MIEVIKKGGAAAQFGKCKYCETLVKCKIGDFKYDFVLDKMYIKCPVCGAVIYKDNFQSKPFDALEDDLKETVGSSNNDYKEIKRQVIGKWVQIFDADYMFVKDIIPYKEISAEPSDCKYYSFEGTAVDCYPVETASMEFKELSISNDVSTKINIDDFRKPNGEIHFDVFENEEIIEIIADVMQEMTQSNTK